MFNNIDEAPLGNLLQPKQEKKKRKSSLNKLIQQGYPNATERGK